MNRLTGFLLLSVLFVTGTNSLISLGKELGALDPVGLGESITLGEEDRIARGLALCERKLSGPEGREFELYRSLRSHSEEDAQVFLLGSDPLRTLAAQSHLRILLHPRTIWRLDRLPEDWRQKANALGKPVYLVEFDRTERVALEGTCALIHSGRSIHIWRLRSEQD